VEHINKKEKIIMLENLQFWTMLVAVLAFVAKFFFPEFPFDDTQILAAVLFILGLFGIVPQFRMRGIFGVTFVDLLKSKAFLTMVAGLVVFVVNHYAPTFPITEVGLVSLFVWVLAFFGIVPELRNRGVL